MKILLAASESVPFCKTGGLADVVGALSRKLGAAGHDVRLFLPKYRAVSGLPRQESAQALAVSLGPQRIDAGLRSVQWGPVSVHFIDCPPLFDREGLYTVSGKDHPDNDLRFSLFSKAVLEGAKAIGFKPDVIHCHDWQTALIPAYLKRHYASDPFFSSTACVLTIHNIAYQGLFPAEAAAKAGFEQADMTPERFEYFGKFSFLKAGLVTADILSTVSPTYAGEIQGPERGFGMEGVLSARKADLNGILNGIDIESWDPGRDPALPERFTAADWRRGKESNRRALSAECGLAGPDLPLIGIVSRLDHQKGLDLAIAALTPRLERCRLVVLGDGDPALRQSFKDLARRRPGAVHFHSGFDDPFARRVYAGSDLFLMPSRFEPCGLGQLIAMRYGAVPVVSRTGGLADTVSEGPGGNGFLCAAGDAEDLERALDRALAAVRGASWDALVARAMGGDFSWERSVALYVELYRRAGRKPAMSR
jgi:starch synthase